MLYLILPAVRRVFFFLNQHYVPWSGCLNSLSIYPFPSSQSWALRHDWSTKFTIFCFVDWYCWVILCYVIAVTRFSEAWYRSNILNMLTCSTGQRFLQPGCHIVMLTYRNWIFQKPNQNTKCCRKLGVFSIQSELQLQFKQSLDWASENYIPCTGFEEQVVLLDSSLVEGYTGVLGHHLHSRENIICATSWKTKWQ